MRGGEWILALNGTVFLALVLCRCCLWLKDRTGREAGGGQLQKGICQCTGNREVQADRAQVWTNSAGTMAVLADGIGRANTGAICAQIAVDTILDRFEPYHELNDPLYFFRTAFYEANQRIQKTLGERRGGACVGAVFMSRSCLYYAIAGDVRLALLRGEELIPLGKGQTMDVLAAQAYEDGKISRQDAVWSMEEKRVWNYMGREGFRDIETCTVPVRLKPGDMVLVASKGVFEELSWGEMEDILISGQPVQELAERLVQEAEKKEVPEKENGSVILLQGTEA